jgi:hypothetical protein
MYYINQPASRLSCFAGFQQTKTVVLSGTTHGRVVFVGIFAIADLTTF